MLSAEQMRALEQTAAKAQAQLRESDAENSRLRREIMRESAAAQQKIKEQEEKLKDLGDSKVKDQLENFRREQAEKENALQ